jgi:hypothetical protein
MAFWFMALVYVVGTVLYDVLRPKPSFDSPNPSSLGDFQFPSIGEGRPIPIVWGTCKLSGPMVTWYGDLQIKAITKKVKTGIFSSKKITTGYKYYLGVQVTLCSGPLDEVLEIRFDDRRPPAARTSGTDFTSIHIDAPGFFGGNDSEGGIQGYIYVYHGTKTQTPDSYLEARLGENLPAWRGVSYAVFRQVYMGTTPYMKAVSFVVRRCPNSLGLTGGAENISGDANPAAMIYDLLTNPPSENGLGIPSEFLDIPAFREVGQTLFNEQFGLSMLQDRSTSAKELVLEILRHIDGVMYVEPTTGLLKLRLIRFDYEPETIPVLDVDSCTLKSFARPSWGDLKNTVRVAYVGRESGYIEKTAQAQDLAAIEVQGGEVALQNLSLRGLSNANTAQIAAARGLAAVSYPLATTVIEADRSAWAFRPGGVFKLVWDPLGIEGMVCRLVRVGTGRLDSGKIEIEAMEDVFAVDWTGYTAPPASGWQDPSGDVPALWDQAALLAPYEAVKDYGILGPGVQLATVLAARGTGGISLGFKVYPDDGAAGWDPATDIPFFTPSGVLASGITELTSEITLTDLLDTDSVESISEPDFALGANLAWITHDGLEEFIAFQTVVTGGDTLTLQTLARGCLDTAPTAFPAGTRIWFISHGSELLSIRGPIAPAETATTDLKFQPYNNQGEYAFGSCLDSQITAPAPARPERVYCPTDVRFNGMSYPDTITGELTVSWAHRNRLGSWSYADSGRTDTPEPGTEYDILVYGETDELIHTETGLTGTTWTYLEADEIADSGLGRLNEQLRVVIQAFGSGRARESFQVFQWEMNRN